MKKCSLLIALVVFSLVLAASAVACSNDDNGGGATATVPAAETPTVGETPSASGEAQIDISGDWVFSLHFDGTSSGGVPCTATITQTGTGLSMGADCIVPPITGHHGTFSGTIDTATGDFSMSGGFVNAFTADLTATASPDGNSMNGSFTGGGLSGTFDGVR